MQDIMTNLQYPQACVEKPFMRQPQPSNLTTDGCWGLANIIFFLRSLDTRSGSCCCRLCLISILFGCVLSGFFFFYKQSQECIVPPAVNAIFKYYLCKLPPTSREEITQNDRRCSLTYCKKRYIIKRQRFWEYH